MGSTFTYTARSVGNPDRAITATLVDGKLYLQLGAGLPTEEDEESTELDARRRLLREARVWLKPMAFRMLERGVAPFSVHDVFAGSEDDGFWLAAWVRVGGLRLVPVVVAIGAVDNPDGARAFVSQLEERKEITPRSSASLGPLDFWGTWIFAAVLIVALIRRQNDRS